MQCCAWHSHGAQFDVKMQAAASITADIQVSTELLQKYLDLEKNIILRFFLRFAGM